MTAQEVIAKIRDEVKRIQDDVVSNTSYIKNDLRRFLSKLSEEIGQEETVYQMNGLMQQYIKEGETDTEQERRFRAYQAFWNAMDGEEEPVTKCNELKGLDEELFAWRHEHFDGDRDGNFSGEYLTRESQLDIARHFYELGRNEK
jgi:arginine utilization protein RocB